jgi:hypothetical protein
MSVSNEQVFPGRLRASVPFTLALLAVLGLAGSLQAEQVSGVEVTGRLPTSTVVTTAGKTFRAVSHDIRLAADQVCSNADRNGDLRGTETTWCSNAATDRALVRYRVLLRQARDGRQVAAADTAIFVALR